MKHDHINQDDMLKERIKDILWNKFDNGDLGINIQIEEGYVTLQGIVDTLSEKEAAAKMVQTVPGVKGLDNSLTVSMDGTIGDDDISQAVQEKVQQDQLLRDAGLEVETHKGIITLHGKVRTLAEARQAKNIAAKVMGAKEIISNIKVTGDPDAPKDDATLVNNVEAAFAASREVEAEDIRTTCSKGVVYLEGTVDTVKQKQRATYWATTVPGVQRVVNHLTTRHGGTDKDSELTNLLREELRRNPWATPGAQIESYVLDGIAYLGGEVYSVEAKTQAELAAVGIKGIRMVQNDIEVARH